MGSSEGIEVINGIFNLPSPGEVTGIGIIGVIVALCLPLFIALFIARFRSWFAAIWFIPALLMTLQFVICKVDAVNSYLTSGNALANGLLYGFIYVCYPINLFHYIISQSLIGVAKMDMLVDILSGEIFAFVFYDVLFVLFFAIFKKRKHKKVKKYDDDF